MSKQTKSETVRRRCFTKHPTKSEQEQINKDIEEHGKKKPDELRLLTNGVVEIPVVVYVHCPYRNKVDMQTDVDNFITSLNANFSGNVTLPTNVNAGTYKPAYDSYVALKTPVQVSFVKQNIVYKSQLSVSSQDLAKIDTQVKGRTGAYSVPSTNYGKTLNIWLVTFTNGLLGYAQFPWELKAKPYYDGVVIDYRTIASKFKYAPYDLNRTAVHEVGHWLGLYHTFQYNPSTFADGVIDTNKDGVISTEEKSGDCVTDTPKQSNPNYGNPYTGGSASWPLEPSTGKLCMFMNYMDYVDDAAMFMFTKEQATKIKLMVNIYRPLLL